MSTTANKQELDKEALKKQLEKYANTTIGKRFKKDTYWDEEAYEMLRDARMSMVFNQRFWGSLVMELALVEDPSGFLTTLATDGKHIFYSADFVKKLGEGKDEKAAIRQRVFGLAHELNHCIKLHCGKTRAGDRDPNLWNIAIDFNVNGDLVEGGVGDMIDTIPILHSEKYYGWFSEEIYDDIVQQCEKNKCSGGSQNGDGSGDGDASGSQFGDTLDKHIEVVVDDNMSQEDAEPGQIVMSSEEYEKTAQNWDKAFRKAAMAHEQAKQTGKGAGNLPSSIQRLIDELYNPVVPWYNILRKYLKRIQKAGYSYSSPNKALFQSGMTIPGFRKYDNSVDLAVAVDASGSVSPEELTQMMSEIMGIMKSFGKYKLALWCFDAQPVEESFRIVSSTTPDHKANLQPFLENAAGLGGTLFEPNWKFMQDKGIKPRAFLILSDGGYGDSWGISGYCPTIFLLTGGTKAESDFGVTIHYEDYK